jgi:NADH-quinone oxidoreductase subunit E
MLSAEAMRKIDREIAKYPPEQRQSAVMSCLAIAQHEQGYVTPEAMAFVARHLGMPPIAVEEVASFYTMFDTAPVGKYKLVICTNLPCALRGANEAADHLKKRTGCGWNETSADGRFTLKEGECFGACGDAPVMLVNNKRMASFMTPEAIDKLLKELE